MAVNSAGKRELFMHDAVHFLEQWQGLGVGFVQGGFPEQHGGAVAVAPDHRPSVGQNALGEPGLFVVIELPARIGHGDQQAQFVAGVHEGRVQRVMRGADHIAAALAQEPGIAPLTGVGQGVAHIGVVLVAIGAAEFMAEGLVVDE